MNTVTREALIRARDYILRNGWCRNEYRLPDGRVCMLGALSATGAYDHPETTAPSALRRVIRAKVKVPQNLNPIAVFNDDVAKDVDDVIAMFNEAIALPDTSDGGPTLGEFTPEVTGPALQFGNE